MRKSSTSLVKRSLAVPRRATNSARSLLVALALAGAAACSSGGSGGSGGTGAGTGGAGVGGAGVPSPLVFKECTEATTLGNFAISLLSEATGAQFNGKVKNSVTPSEVNQVLVEEGLCRIMIGPEIRCTTMAPPGSICAGNDTFVPEPTPVNVGKIDVSGLGSAVSVGDDKITNYFTAIPKTAFPPYVLGNSIGMSAAGGVYAPFSMAVRGIAPLDVPEQTLMLASGQPLTVTWTPVPETATGNIEVTLDIAHHGGIAAQLKCDWPDTGSGTISGSLITALIARGTAGFPVITLARESVDSAAVATGGCINFKVLSSVERKLMVEGVTSCSDSEVPPLKCPTGTCGLDMKCH